MLIVISIGDKRRKTVVSTQWLIAKEIAVQLRIHFIKLPVMSVLFFLAGFTFSIIELSLFSNFQSEIACAKWNARSIL